MNKKYLPHSSPPFSPTRGYLLNKASPSRHSLGASTDMKKVSCRVESEIVVYTQEREEMRCLY